MKGNKMDLENIVGLIAYNDKSYAVRSHRQKMQNPGLRITITGTSVRWLLLGLQPGAVEKAEDDDVDHLDFYIFRNEFVRSFPAFPVPTVAPGGGSLPPKFPWGKEGSGKPPIQPGTPRLRFPITLSQVKSPTGQFKAKTQGDCFLHIDY